MNSQPSKEKVEVLEPSEDQDYENSMKQTKNPTSSKSRRPTMRNTDNDFEVDQEPTNYFWDNQQCLKYRNFLRENYEILLKGLKEKKAFKVNIKMSHAVGTRNAAQCRSHHQKMLKRHKKVYNIIEFLEGLQGSDNMDLEVNKFSSQTDISGTIQAAAVELKEIAESTKDNVSLWDQFADNCWDSVLF